MNKEFTIYTDGSSRGNPGPGGWAAIIMQSAKGKMQNGEAGAKNNNAGIRELGGREERTTNNRMELKAAIEGLKAVPTSSKVVLNADSEYVVKGMTLWIKGWIAKNWRTAAKKAVLNQDLWRELLKAVEGKSIEWKVVLGHSGVAQNERADVIATSFADNMPIELRNMEVSPR
jgi:ribonuclease HI